MNTFRPCVDSGMCGCIFDHLRIPIQGCNTRVDMTGDHNNLTKLHLPLAMVFRAVEPSDLQCSVGMLSTFGGARIQALPPRSRLGSCGAHLLRCCSRCAVWSPLPCSTLVGIAMRQTGSSVWRSWWALVVTFVLIMRSPALATKVGELSNRLIGPLRNRIKAIKDLDLAAPIIKFRGGHVCITQTAMGGNDSGSNRPVSFSQFLILYVALRGIEGVGQRGHFVCSCIRCLRD